jgi:hypothetical protein
MDRTEAREKLYSYLEAAYNFWNYKCTYDGSKKEQEEHDGLLNEKIRIENELIEILSSK